MSWIQENKFLTGLLAVTAVGAAILIFLLMGASARYDDTAEQFTQQTAELKRLQGLKPYPEENNFSRLTAQKDEQVAEVQKLRDELGAMELPKEAISPEQFQDSLRSKVSALEALANENGVALPEGFYLGFPTYQGRPPKGDATERLGWQLRTIESVVRGVINAKVSSIDLIERQPLPEESAAASSAPVGGNAAKGKSNPNGKGEGESQDLVSRYPFTLAFTGEQSRVRIVLNQIANTKDQFLITRTLKIENEQTVGPPKAGAAGDGAAGGGLSAPVDNTTSIGDLLGGEEAGSEQINEAARKLAFILGSEKVKAVLTVDIVDFAEANATGQKQAQKRP